jgi:hypothetical protein
VQSFAIGSVIKGFLCGRHYVPYKIQKYGLE